MSDDYNKNDFNMNENGSQSENDKRDETPRWQPDPVRYNTSSNVVTQVEKPKKRWLIPLCIVIGLMVAAICVAIFFGIKTINDKVKSLENNTYNTAINESSGGELTVADTSSVKNGSIIITDVSEVVEKVMPSVVSVTSRSFVYSGGYGGYWSSFFGNGQQTEVESGIGSGTIISKNDSELLILTSYHVVEGSSSLFVTFNNDVSVDGYIKAVSESDDIAVVAVPLSEIDQDTMNAIKIATVSFEKPKVGEGVIVIGDALGYGQSVTTGIISAIDKDITVEGRDLIALQTDAAINNGNSGGCMLNSRGEVIGISEAKISNSAVEGMCYAIQISSYSSLIEDLVSRPSTAQQIETPAATEGGAFLGIYGADIDSEKSQEYDIPEGVYVSNVIAGGGAEAAGIVAGDVIVGVDNVKLSTMDALQSVLATHKPGDTVELTLYRYNGNTYTLINLTVVLTQRIS